MSRSSDQAAKGGKGKKRKATAGDGDSDGVIRVGAHPAARRSIRRARAWSGIAGFVVVLLLAVQAGVPHFEAVMRALAAGLALHFTAWAFAIALWRRLVLAELEAARERLETAS